MNLRARWTDYWYAPTASVRLDAFRQALLYTLAFYMLARFMHASEWLTPIGYHPSPAADARHAPHVPLLPPSLLPAFALALFGGLALAILDRLRRPAIAVLLALVLYVNLADPISSFTLNRLYVFSLLLLLLAPTGPTIPAWPIRALQLSLLTHYFASALCKAFRGDWLRHDDVLWMQIQGLYMTDAAAWMVRVLPTWTFAAQQHLALGFELLAPVLLGVRRLRPLGFLLGVGMHLLVAVTMEQLIYFSLQMLAFYAVFLDEAALLRWRERLTGPARRSDPTAPHT